MHYKNKLDFETDSRDLNATLKRGENAVVLDAHFPRAVNFPHRKMGEETTRHLGKAALFVTYCDGFGCNASTKATLRVAELGFRVKELIGATWIGGKGTVTKLSEAEGQCSACGCGTPDNGG